MTLRCVIVDDSRAVLRTGGELLESQGIDVVGVAANGDEAMSLAEELQPDVVLVDIVLGAESGFDLACRLAAAGSPVILISTREEADFADLIAASPAIGFLSKSELSAAAVHRLLDKRRDAGR